MIEKPKVKKNENSLTTDLHLDEQAFWLKYQATRNQVQKVFKFTPLRSLNSICRFIEIASNKNLDRPIDRPIFLLGNFRSGTTFLESLITSHPTMGYYTYLSQAFPLSYKIPYFLFNRFSSLSKRVPAIHQPKIMVNYKDPFECEAIWGYSKKSIFSEVDTHILDSTYSDPKFERLLLNSINSHLSVQKKTRFVNKNPLCTLRIGYLAKIFPSALFIYLVRHPYRVLQSQLDLERMSGRVFKGLDFFKEAMFDTFHPPRTFFRTHNYNEIIEAYKHNNVLGVAKYIVDFDEEFDRQVVQEKLEHRMMKLRYEDLMLYPEISLTKILNFLDIEDGFNNLIKKLKTESSPELLNAQLPDFDSEIEAILAPNLAKYGY